MNLTVCQASNVTSPRTRITHQQCGQDKVYTTTVGCIDCYLTLVVSTQKDTEKYMCEKHKVFFRMRLTEWKKDLVKANNEALYFGSMDDNSISADVVDQASSYTDKNVEMKAINRQIKLISEIDKILKIK